MLYTRKGDKGDTSIFGCDQRYSKSSAVAEALGTLDEINSFLGVCKTKAENTDIACPTDDGHRMSVRVNGIDGGSTSIMEIINNVQQNLFIVQAEVASVKKTIEERKVKEVEAIVDAIEKELPPVKSFFVSGGTELAASLDFARTLARRAERRVVAVSEEGVVKVGEYTLAYLNRLSSLLYALTRLVNLKSDITEQSPTYE